MTPTPPSGRPTYHHGDLPAALVEATLAIVNDAGVQGFSVAEAARRTGVSPAAPYRHFADREALLVAAAATVSRRLLETYVAAIAGTEEPAEQLAALSGTYVRAAASYRGGFDLLFAVSGWTGDFPELRGSTRALLDVLLPIAQELVPDGDAAAAVALLEAHNALARGYATLLLEGLFGEPDVVVEGVAARASAAARALTAGQTR
ncbi:MAG: regulatory protein TetR [Conexibacter sp.]|jgi:AcrR family transcriptional regulator|nr:regulatory protein TetR [Conexibacter sp.]